MGNTNLQEIALTQDQNRKDFKSSCGQFRLGRLSDTAPLPFEFPQLVRQGVLIEYAQDAYTETLQRMRLEQIDPILLQHVFRLDVAESKGPFSPSLLQIGRAMTVLGTIGGGFPEGSQTRAMITDLMSRLHALLVCASTFPLHYDAAGKVALGPEPELTA